MKTSSLACFALAAAVALLEPAPAEACGGCFVQQREVTVVTDHRMALAVSPEQTVLWDQIRYSGDPAEFAWVLPVRPGATVQLSNDAFFTALDASTQTVVIAPFTYGGAMGCGLTGCGSQTADAQSSGPGAGQVQILSQSVVGPYETVTLRATDPGALRNWLKSHAFAIPPAIEPTIDAYVRDTFDFIALRLRPDCGERAMRPVRIVTPGADPTLPLRMVAAGIGAKVGLTLFVISEGRYQPRNFPHTLVDPKAVLWDRIQSKSNYAELTDQLMSQSSGRTWVVEYANKPQLYPSISANDPGARTYAPTPSGPNPGFADAYFGQCNGSGVVQPSTSASAPSAQPFTPCRNGSDAGVPTSTDGGGPEPRDAAAEASDDGGATHDAGTDDGGALDDGGADDGGADPDAGAPLDDGGLGQPGYDAGPPPPPTPGPCDYLDDIDVAVVGLHWQDVWVTRLRASLPANALAAGDLKLEASPDQTPVSSTYYPTAYTDESSAASGAGQACLSAPKRHTAFGSWVLATMVGLALVALLRRRTRP